VEDIDWPLVLSVINVLLIVYLIYKVCKMAARDNLNSALTALDASASALDQAVSNHVAAHANVMGEGDVQAVADNVFRIINVLQTAANKLTPSG
jgi:hypothetical protein